MAYEKASKRDVTTANRVNHSGRDWDAWETDVEMRMGWVCNPAGIPSLFEILFEDRGHVRVGDTNTRGHGGKGRGRTRGVD